MLSTVPVHTARNVPFALLVGTAVFLNGCAEETVAHQQMERQANRILVLLKNEGLDPNKVKDDSSRDLRFKVLVPQDQAASALSVLEKHNLPETPKPSTADMFESGGMIPTTEQERAKRVVGVEGDIVNALRSVPRVIDVQAGVSIPEDNPLRDVNEARPRPKAAVIVVFDPDERGAPPMTSAEFQQFVQAKLPDLRSSEVSVQLVRNPTAAPAGSNGAGNEVAVLGTAFDPNRACEKESVIGIVVCKGNRKKVINIVLGAVIVAGLLAGLAVIAVLRAMRYRKDLTRLTAQFQQVRK